MLINGLITFDEVFVENQSVLARFFLKNQGQNVRQRQEYEALASVAFGDGNILSHMRSNMTSIPYTHIIMECSKH